MPDVAAPGQGGVIEVAALETMVDRVELLDVLEHASPEQITDTDTVVELLDATEQNELIELGIQGPPGAGAAPGVSLPAGVDGVLAHHAVMLAPDGTLSHMDPALADSFVGVSKNAAVAGDPVVVATRDTVSEPTWTWSPGLPVFAGVGGALTQTPPTTVCVAHIGVAITPTTLLLSKTQPVFIGA